MRNVAHLAFAFSILAACSGPGPKADDKALIMMGRITAMEDSLFNNEVLDDRNAQALLDVYKAYATSFPTDSMAPEYLFRAAGLAAKSMGDAPQGIRLYDRVISNYPDWKRIPDVFYLKAFTIDSELGQKGEAKKAYQQVISMFPDHRFAQDARRMMEYLDLTDEELIRKFQEAEQAQASDR
ncbi:MAG: tetratricopeptide repeat protein [Flavobacteriales bacterium]|nr:tetratricopeptide repeat protein [Flavobacteriales bacterium]